MSSKIVAFIPAYRCAPQIGRVIHQFARPEISDRFDEILVLDNQSPDDTIEAAFAAARQLNLRKVTIARNMMNYGLGGSHKAAFCHALDNGYSHLAVLHGDDQGSIKDLMPVLAGNAHQTNDCCLGARFHPQATIRGYSPIRVMGNHVFNMAFSAVSGQRLYDLGSGLNLYSMSALAGRYWWRFRDDLMFNYCMILAHVAKSQKIEFFPISWRENDQISNVKLFSQASKTLKLLGSFAMNRQAFLNAEMRDVPRDTYAFEIIGARV